MEDQSFFRSHAGALFGSLLGFVISVFAFVGIGPLIAKMGMPGIFYYMLLGTGALLSALLPLHWALRHRRFRRAMSGERQRATSESFRPPLS